jgi:hypothetical protein
VSHEPPRHYRAGQRVDDQCRACKVTRVHVVVAANPDGTIAQVQCDFCGSRHRYHGGAGDMPRAAAAPAYVRERGVSPSSPIAAPLVAEVERSFAMTEPQPDFEMILRRVIREETGLTAVAPAEKWRGGDLVLRPRASGLQEKTWPIESFFHKVVMLRNRLRVLEQNVNTLEIPDDVKLKLQSYITGCYGSLTSFNVLFADAEDRFRGTGSED